MFVLMIVRVTRGCVNDTNPRYEGDWLIILVIEARNLKLSQDKDEKITIHAMIIS